MTGHQRNAPVFLWHTTEDKVVPPENSVQFYMSCVRAGVPAELHIFEKGRHGLGLAKNMPGASAWPDLCREWLESSTRAGASNQRNLAMFSDRGS
ncbi:MAG: prolyl oligopeptidase family serine peptidase [Pirellulaceae bacterium]